MVVNVSNELVWEVVRGRSSFLKKKTNGPYQFTTEPGNLTGVNAYEFSTLVHSDNITVEANTGDDDEDSGSFNIDLVYTVKGTEKKPKDRTKTTLLKDASGPKRNNRKIKKHLDAKFYREGVDKYVLRRYTKLYKSMQRARKLRKSRAN